MAHQPRAPCQDDSLIRLPQDAVAPDYRAGGLYGLVASFADYLNGKPWHAPGTPISERIDDRRISRALVFILIDGLGDDFLQHAGTGSTLLTHRQQRLTSVFPSTTASAVTTTLTGLAPAKHGLTGWFIHDSRFGGVLAPLPMVRRTGAPVRGPLALPRLFPYRTLFQHRKRPSILVSPQNLAFSRFSVRHSRGARVLPYKGIQGMNEAIIAAVHSLNKAGGFVHAYYPTFDALSHTYGSTASEVITQFRRIDAAFSDLAQRLQGSNTDIVVSADHGFIDSPAEHIIDINEHTEARRMLSSPLFGERRAAFCIVRPGAAAEFQAFASEELSGKAVVLPASELLESGLLGPGKMHRRLTERIGNHAILMESDWTIRDHLPNETEHIMIGVHGGLSRKEMWIPLICAHC